MRKGIFDLILNRPASREFHAEFGNAELVKSPSPEVPMSLPPVLPPLPKSQ